MLEFDFLNILIHILNVLALIGAALGIFLSVRWLIRYRHRHDKQASTKE